MSEGKDQDRKIITSKGGVLFDMTNRIKLILRLIADRRINPLLKLLPIGSVLYFFVPDLAPGPIDDVVIIWLGSYLFVELCPPEIVEEHMSALNQVIPGQWNNTGGMDDDVVDAEFWEKKD